MKKILIVEDDQIVANLYRNKFSVEGYQVEVAFDGEAGLETLRAFRPDAVILDLMLPKLSGVELMKRIRAESDFQEIPVIVFSNTYLTNLVQEAWKAGATKCLSKANCTPKQVFEVVRGALPANGASRAATLAVRKPAQTAPPSGTVYSADVSADLQEELRESLVEALPATLASLRTALKGVIKARDEAGRLKELTEMSQHIHVLTGNAGVVGLLPISRMCEALEALLKELCEKPKNINASTLRTVAAAVDFLGVLFERGTEPDKQQTTPANILVVDDEPISRRAVGHALEKAKLQCVSVESPKAAYAALMEKSFDLIFLDVNMPEMSGFELCTKLRALPAQKETPVVFVTSLNDLECRASSTMSGGNDFIAKPFMFIELAVKALVYVLRGRLGAAR